MVSLLRPKRFVLCGVPITYELALRLSILGLTVAVLIFATRPKVLSILQQANVVSVTMKENPTIPVPGVMVCGLKLDKVDVQILTRGEVYANGTIGKDQVQMIVFSRTVDFNLRAYGDWPSEGNCVQLKPKDLYFAKNLDGKDRNAVENIIFVAQSNVDLVGSDDTGLSIAIWDGNAEIKDQQPIWTSTPSINTLTFVYNEHILMNKTKHLRFATQKQNLRTIKEFANRKVIGRVVISPDTFFVTSYIDKMSYTWVDLAGAIGGMASLALAVWIYLFGSGRYKSWGVMQRYILKTSPNSKRFREKEKKPVGVYESFKLFIRKQLERMDSSRDSDLDHVPLHNTASERQRLSIRYSTAINMHPSHTPLTGSDAEPGREKRASGMNFSNGYNAKPGEPLESPSQPNFYFSDEGTPRTLSLQPLAPINENGDDAEVQVDELIRLIDLRIDERMWSLERTLARYYLDGFRLRNYSTVQSSSADATSQKKDENSPSMLESDPHTQMELLSHDQPSSTASSPPPVPMYPPRPRLDRQYTYVGEAPGKEEDSSEIQVASGVSTLPSTPTMQQGEELSAPTFPLQRDMRGTIRKAVERLQQEWPQNQDPKTYVPRTQYESSRNTTRQQQQ
ncbi:hypothetical protein BGZ51_001608 [Haplosporangium sp. Z 767]|nr:hypothetical protein BGZ50_008706 [Haplosporangium sp. Z 11]KAF9187034.1 hypothetical protein BGZ51_001608 [Haplosporangium sp. Z 767]